ncbi:UNVERIFIED_CONTAM: hypothetical protein PYX00_008326 [Menopon gallinae]|uniref:Uncharacterized protein n=1 Tax=Menopon gallinae TaxID=328185 RepID=A0AAW2HNB6_9NEOP
MSHDYPSRHYRRQYRCSDSAWQYAEPPCTEKRRHKARQDIGENLLKYSSRVLPDTTGLRRSCCERARLPRWTVPGPRSDKTSTQSAELSAKSALSSSTRIGLDRRKYSDEKMGFTSADSIDKPFSGTDGSDMETTRTYTLTKFRPNICALADCSRPTGNWDSRSADRGRSGRFPAGGGGGIRNRTLRRPRNFPHEISRNFSSSSASHLENPVHAEPDAVRTWNESWKKSKLLLEALHSQRMLERRAMEMRKQKKKQQRKVSKVERAIDAEEDLKSILEQLRLANLSESKTKSSQEEEKHPAYFLLKVSQESIAELKNRNGVLKDMKLVLASEKNSRTDVSRKTEHTVRMKDQILQTCYVTEEPRLPNPQQETPRETSRLSCNLCEKVEKDIRSQNELNVSMLGQMKDVMQQLVAMTNLLRDMILHKQSQAPSDSNSSKATKNVETEVYADSSSQTLVDEEEQKASANEEGRKSSVGSKSGERDLSVTTSDVPKLNKLDELPFAPEYREFEEQRASEEKRRKGGFFKMCCWSLRDVDSLPDNYTDEDVRDNRSEKAEEGEHVVGDFRRDAMNYWERRCSSSAADDWEKCVHGKRSVHRSCSSHSNMCSPTGEN